MVELAMTTDTPIERPIPERESGLVALAEARGRSSVGGKAATLGDLTRAGYCVPDGVVLSVDLCARISRDGRVGSALRAEIAAALAHLGGSVAVRSSAVAEDGSRASFAGQLLTRLQLSELDAVCEAVVECATSLAAAAAYRATLAPQADLGVAVILQRMVAADAAGVSFSVNPATGDDEVSINAVAGLGDALVSGEVPGEAWIVRADEVVGPNAGAIDAEAAREIARLTRRLADELGGPVDVEWALSGGALHVLQARLITAVPVEPQLEDPTEGLWMRDSVHHAATITAFGASTNGEMSLRALAEIAPEFGLVVERFDAYWRSGDLYGRMVPVGGKEGPAPPWWVMAIVSRLHPGMRRRMRAARRAFESGLLERVSDEWERTGRDAYRSEIERLAAVDLAGLSDEALAQHLEAVLDFMYRGQVTHFRLFVPYLVGTHQFVQTVQELLGWSELDAMRLLSGTSTASSAPGTELAALAARIRATGVAERVRRATDPVAELAALDPPLGEALAGWVARWGLRATAYDAGAPTLGEQPGLLDGRIREALETEAAPPELGAPLLAKARAALEGPALERFEAAYERAAKVYPQREDNVLYTDNLIAGLARRTALELGRRMARRGHLRRAEDAVELRVDELRSAFVEARDVGELAHRRRCERAWVAAHPGPALLNGPAHAPPNLRGLPAHGRIVNQALMWAMGHEYPDLMGGTEARGDALEVEDPAALTGIPAWPGVYTGTVRIVSGERDLDRVRPGDVLVARITVPAWSIVFPRIGALVTDVGGALSHAAIVAREHGVPTVLNTQAATTTLRDGQRVTVDGARGTVTPV